jgi:hypothetical protein
MDAKLGREDEGLAGSTRGASKAAALRTSHLDSKEEGEERRERGVRRCERKARKGEAGEGGEGGRRELERWGGGRTDPSGSDT